MSRSDARVSIDDLNRHLTRLGVYPNEVLHPDGTAGIEYVSRRSRRPVATVDRTRGGSLKWMAAIPAAAAAAVASHATAFAVFQA